MIDDENYLLWCVYSNITDTLLAITLADRYTNKQTTTNAVTKHKTRPVHTHNAKPAALPPSLPPHTTER